MKKTRWLSVVLALVLVLSLCTPAFAADSKPAAGENDPAVVLREKMQQNKIAGQYTADDQVRVIVLTESQPTAENHGMFQRFTNTDRKLMREHSAVKTQMDKQQIDYEVNFEYTSLLNGMSVTMAYGDMDKVASMPGVEAVVLAKEYRRPVTEPSSVSASDMIGASALSQYLSADGSGKVIAVLDTGITAGHEAFAVYDGMLQTPALEQADAQRLIGELGHGVYLSQKIPFAYDYADGDKDASDDGSGHGSHVAGIAAGYTVTEEGEVTFHGSAPDAQILAMKIFASESPTTSSDIYIAALEDAYDLGADVINMSIGAPNGFVEDAESALNYEIYHRLEKAGIICCMSAGNENTMGEYTSNWLGAYVRADYADYGVLGSPASYDGNVAVAAVENVEFPAYMIAVGEENFPYRESDGTAFLDAFGGKDLEYVMVPGLGTADDFAKVDVKDKVAVISRGETTFGEKVANAVEAGAIGAVVYDNVPGALVTMAIDDHVIPSIFVSQEAGAALAAAEGGTFHVNGEKAIAENPEAYSVSAFSSWGPTNDLQIKPTISGVGGNVNSVSAGTKDGYEVMSGTSMSAPNVSGGYAALLEAISADNPKLSKAEAAAIARNITVSHAAVLPADVVRDENGYPAKDENGYYTYVPFSPRQQGSGLLDLVSAYTAVLNIADPLAELGDDPAKTGVYTITADLENTSDAERTYFVSADVLTDSAAPYDWGDEDAPDYHIYNLLSPTLLEEGVDYTMDAPETVTLAAGEKKTVTVTITLTDDVKDYYLDAAFDNGTFIDGYVYFDYFDAETYDSEQAHVTFLGFYGDWSAGAILETHDWRELMDLDNPFDYLPYVDWEIDTVPAVAYPLTADFYMMGYNGQPVMAGGSLLGMPEDGVYSDARIAVSNNADEAYCTLLLVDPTIIRNARHVIMIARNAETGEIYAVDDTPFCSKTIYDPDNGDYFGFVRTAEFLFDGMDSYSGEEPVPVADDTAVVLEFYANLPYGEDVLGSMTPEQIVKDGADYLEYTVPCVVDGAAPVIEDCEYDPETGDLTVTVSDNQYLAGIYAMDEEFNEIGETVRFADDEAGESHTVTMNVGEQTGIYVAAMDYATNESYVYVVGLHDHDWSEWEVLTEATCEADGEQKHVCSICGEEETEVIKATGHDLKEVKEVAATCDKDGAKAHYKCDTCGKLFADAEGKQEIKAPEAIPASHSIKAVAEVPATCEKDGAKAHYKCDVCGKLFADAEGKQEIKAPEAIPAGHSLKAVAEVPATCLAEGVKAHYKCDVCGKLFSDANGKYEIAKPETIAKLGHSLSEVAAVAATCEKDGAKAHYKCDTCGKLFSDAKAKHEIEAPEAVAKLGHSPKAVAEVPATCEADGVKAYFECKTCGKLFADEACTKQIEKPEVLAKLGHAWDEGVVTKEPTLVSEGEKLFTCKNDPSHTRVDIIAKLYDCDGGDKCPSKDFTDVNHKPDSWSHEPIDWAVLKGITVGTSKTTFSPSKVCTRAEAVTFLWRAAGCPAPASTDNPFKDVTLDKWYADAVLWAVEQGIVKGTSETTFSPDMTCNRAHIVTFLWRMEKQPEAKKVSGFDDVAASAYYAPAVDWAVEQGIVKGMDPTHFAPKGDCTRAHIVTFLFREFGE